MNAGSQILRPCPVCGQSEAKLWVEKSGMKIVRCGGCSMLYVNPVPATFASGEYYDTEGAEYYLSEAKLESDYAPVRFERELRLFRRHIQKGAVLDVGCSSGAFLFQLRQRFVGDYQISGTDVSGPPLDYAESRGVPVIRGDFLTHDFGDRRFDAITFWAVLEHLSRPKEFLEKAATLLKEEGLCFVLVPNMSSLAVKILGRRYRYIYEQHLNYFTADTLRRLAEPQFDTLEIRTTHFNPVVMWQDWRGGGRDVSNAARGELLRRTTRYKQNPLLWPLKLGYRLSEKTLSTLGQADNLVKVFRKAGRHKPS
jgi:2-polyprenyl-3-methyl-5-hydroxy-6-metoxy-1,4-benzoquinol methylase